LVSKDFQDVLGQLTKQISGGAEPLPDSRVFKARVQRLERVTIVDVETHLESELVADGVERDTINRVLLCFSELVQNAFDHGCRLDEDEIDVTLRIGRASREIVIKQPPHPVFQTLEKGEKVHRDY
jgi:two-component sensor histidine kinase